VTTAHLSAPRSPSRAVAAPVVVRPRRAPASPPRARLLGEFLVQEGLVTEAQLATALLGQEAATPRIPVGQLLVEQGALSATALDEALRRYHKKYRLGDILVETNVISETQLQLGVDHHRRTGLRLGDALLQLGFVNEEMLKLALCSQFDVTFVDLDRFCIDRDLASVVSKAFAQQHRVLPVARVDGALTVALADPTDSGLAESLEAMTGCEVRLVMSSDAAFERAFTRVYGELPSVGLAKQHERLEETHTVLVREYETAVRALRDLREAQETFLRDQAELLRSAAEQAGQQSDQERRLAELQAAHAALREEYETRGRAHAELTRAQSDTLESLTAIRSEHGRLLHEHRDLGQQLAEERERGAELARRLVDLEAAHVVGRRELDERLAALTALDAAYAETTHALATLRAEHETLRGEHERVSRELHERWRVAEGRQHLAVQQLETLLARLRE
jgi:Type II secretion system (T2SS), protein E, N-terminal domain